MYNNNINIFKLHNLEVPMYGLDYPDICIFLYSTYILHASYYDHVTPRYVLELNINCMHVINLDVDTHKCVVYSLIKWFHCIIIAMIIRYNRTYVCIGWNWHNNMVSKVVHLKTYVFSVGFIWNKPVKLRQYITLYCIVGKFGGVKFSKYGESSMIHQIKTI